MRPRIGHTLWTQHSTGPPRHRGGTSHGFRVRTGPATVHILEGRTIP